MNPQFISDELLIAKFFEGTLGADDRDEFLSVYFGDIERLRLLREYVHRHEIAERFLRGELSNPEQEAFEQICLADPDMHEDLIVLERSKDALAELAASGELQSGLQPTRWRSIFGSPQYSVAASVLLAVSILASGILLRDNLALREGFEAGDAAVRINLTPVFAVRGTAAMTIPEPAQNELTVLLIDPILTQYADYRASLRRIGTDGPVPVLEVSGLMPTYDDQLALGLPAAALTPGDYDIVVEGRSSEAGGEDSYEQISTVPLRVAGMDGQ